MADYNPYNTGAVGLVQTVSQRVGFADNGTPVLFPQIQVGDLVLRSHVAVGVAFNDSGTDLIDLGWTGAAEGHAADVDVSSTGVKVAATVPFKLPTGTTYQALYTGQNSDATVGEADVIVEFVPQGE